MDGRSGLWCCLSQRCTFQATSGVRFAGRGCSYWDARGVEKRESRQETYHAFLRLEVAGKVNNSKVALVYGGANVTVQMKTLTMLCKFTYLYHYESNPNTLLIGCLRSSITYNLQTQKLAAGVPLCS